MSADRPIEPRRDIDASISLICEAARPLMEPSLPYHNWEHIQYSLGFAMSECDRLETIGVDINRLMVGAAIALHDSGIAHDLPPQFQSKEEYSANNAAIILKGFGFDDPFIQGVKGCIIATSLDATPKTNEEKITCLADIANIFGPYPGFILNSFRFYQELRAVYGQPQNLRDYKRSAAKILTTYISKDLTVEGDDQGVFDRPRYEIDALKNIDRFLRASRKQLIAALGSQATSYMQLLPEPMQRGIRTLSPRAS